MKKKKKTNKQGQFTKHYFYISNTYTNTEVNAQRKKKKYQPIAILVQLF